MPDELTTLRNVPDLIEAQLDITEPAALDDACPVDSVSSRLRVPGNQWDIGRLVLVGWRYKTIDQKPVIINAGSKQTVIPPQQVAAPALPPPSPLVSITVAGALYEDMADIRWRPPCSNT